MTMIIGGEQIARLTDLRRKAKSLIDRIRKARNPQESRIILTTHSKPVAVLQEYNAYQQLLNQIEEIQRKLQLVEVRERLQAINADAMKTVSLHQVMAQCEAQD